MIAIATVIAPNLTLAEHAFNLLNMRSATDRETAQGGREGIRGAALRLFATEGFDRVSGRAIAKEAGVSPALVMHHFGSVAALRAEIDSWVLGHFEDWIERAGTADSVDEVVDDMEGEVRGFFVREPLLGGYLRQLLVEGGDAGYQFFAGLFDAGREMLSQLEQRGVVRPSPNGDLDARLMLLMAEDLGTIMLEPFLARRLGVQLYSEEFMARWSAAELDLHANGLFGDGPHEEQRDDN